MITEKTKQYLKVSLNSAPLVLSTLLDGAPEGWYDIKVDADRFTLREVVAHLADWEEIFHGRLLQLLNEEHPVLIGIDEGQWSIDHNHSTADVAASLQQYCDGRRRLLGTVNQLSPEDWIRTGTHTETGETSVTDLLTLISAHDSYHQEQVITWRKHLAKVEIKGYLCN